MTKEIEESRSRTTKMKSIARNGASPTGLVDRVSGRNDGVSDCLSPATFRSSEISFRVVAELQALITADDKNADAFMKQQY